MKITARQVRRLRRDNREWPAALKPIPWHEWPQEHATNSSHSHRMGVWRSKNFLVQAYREHGDVIRLSINRTDWDMNKQRWREDISWDDLQRLKGEAGFGDKMAVEIFPADSDTVNVANMRHLWVLPEPLPFAWKKRQPYESPWPQAAERQT